ncbi:MAG: carbohydrate kinase [Pedobacter sp.]
MQEEQKSDKAIMVCFGEVLWDVFPDGAKKPGGAPMNVAYNLRRLGVDCTMISRVGNDDNGKELLKQLETWGMTTEYIEQDPEYPTSTVALVLDEHNDASYTIFEDVAWDNIPLLELYKMKVQESEVLVFGSLAMRSSTSYNTLMELVKLAKIKVLDINLRLPHFNLEKIVAILPEIDVLKLNKAELNFLIEALEVDIETDEHLRIKYIQDRFGIAEIVLTKGSKGANYYRYNNQLHQDAYQIDINDTVGSGDAFFAGFLAARYDLKTADNNAEILNMAIATGAFITTKEGACPPYTLPELLDFQEKRTIR